MRLGALSLLFLSVVLCISGAPGAAHAAMKQASLVVDANTGQVLHEHFADQPRHPASLTKIMTIYMAFAEIAAGRLTYETPITVSERAAGVAPSKLGLKAGEQIALIDAIKALITKSANDMAVAIAEHIGGSEVNFARLMTERARAIGMGSTRFLNASGLPDDRQITTARDMLTLAMRIQDEFPADYRLFSITSFDYRGKSYRTHNTLMFGFPGMDGIKTGYTRSSGFNLVSSVRAGGKHLVAAVFGGETAQTRNAHMRLLLFRSLEKASTQRTRPGVPTQIASARPVEAGQWQAKTIAAQPTPAAKAQKPKAVAEAKAPAKKPKTDEIAAVLAKAPPQPKPAKPSQKVQGNPIETSAAPQARLDLDALRTAMAAPSPEPAAAQPVGMQVSVRPPSTLDAQAQGLAGKTPAFAKAGASAIPSHLNGPVDPQAAKPVAERVAAKSEPQPLRPYEIQIGAYGSAPEAEAKLKLVRDRAPKLLQGHDAIAIPATRAQKQFFRARFKGFDETSASDTCLELRRMAIDCFVMKLE